jgi:hypothetical protein
MNLDCKQVLKDFSLHQNPDLTDQEKVVYKQHFIDCPTCQIEYEAMLHTATVTKILQEPIPPLNLVGRIQTQIRQTHRRSVLDFLANPISRILLALKLGPHPTFVNYTAMLFYLMLTIFLVKVTFFHSTEPPPIATLMKPSQARMRTVLYGDVKRAARKSVRIEGKKPSEVPIQPESNNLQ